VPPPSSEALGIAIRALGRRELSIAEVTVRLERAGVRPDEREATIEHLCASGYLSDTRAARERARILAERGRGDAAIRADLEGRGIGEAAVEAALASLAPENARVEQLVRRLGRAPKLAQTLRRRGFSDETVEGIGGAAVAEQL
jgi:regulatory protein